MPSKVRQRRRLHWPITLSALLMSLNVTLMVCWIVLLAQLGWWSVLTIGTVVFAIILVGLSLYMLLTIKEAVRPTDEQMAQEYSLQHRATNSALFQLSGAEYLAAIIFSGAPDRYPGLKFVLGECGVGWIPYVLARMDDEYEDQFHNLNFSLKPSEYWRRQGYSTFQRETIVADVVHLVGEDNILWGSDYPHPDGVWPDSAKVIEEDLGRLDERVKRKIICENTGKLYGLMK